MITANRPVNKGVAPRMTSYTKSALLLATSLLLLTGCTSNTTTMAQQSSAPVVTAAPGEAINSTQPVASADPVAQGTPDLTASPEAYQITTAEFNQDNIHIKYPQISGLQDASTEKAINDLIKNDIWDSQVQETLDAYEDEPINLDLDMTYEVTLLTDNMLSVMYSGSAYIEGGVHPNNTFHAITIDLKSGKRLFLCDFTQINKDLIEKLKQSKSIHNFVTDNEIQDDALLTELRNSLIGEIQDQDEKFMIWDLKNQGDSAFYLTKDALVIRTYVSHVSGDYVLIDLPGQYVPTSTGALDDTLCLNTEKLVVSFQLNNGSKTVSVCMDRDERYLVYRFGTKDAIELEYPAEKGQSWDKFTYDYDTKTAHNSLQFENGGFQYEVYQQDYAGGDGLKIGIRVTDLSTGKETDLAGLPESLIGYWYDLQGNKNLQSAK